MEQTFIRSEEEILAHNLHWLRTQHSLSQSQMASCMGIGIRSFRQLEKGTIPPRLKVSTFYLLYERFHVTPSQLLTQRLDI